MLVAFTILMVGCSSTKSTQETNDDTAVVQDLIGEKLELANIKKLVRECLGRNYLELRNSPDLSNEEKTDAILDRCYEILNRDCLQTIKIVRLSMQDQGTKVNPDFFNNQIANCPKVQIDGLRKGVTELLNSSKDTVKETEAK